MTGRLSSPASLHDVFPALQDWAAWAARRVGEGHGILLGETAVLSTCLHLLRSDQPGYVTILRNRDAGQVFYGRRRAGQVFHLDVFHAEANVDHRQTAQKLITAMALYRRDFGACLDIPKELHHYVDVQTATGGGRITGQLIFGQRASLRQAHRTHVHLTFLAPPRHAAALFYLVAGVEAALQQQHVGLRRLDGIYVENSEPDGDGIPLSEYASSTDSWIRGQEPPQQQEEGVGGRGQPGGEPLAGEEADFGQSAHDHKVAAGSPAADMRSGDQLGLTPPAEQLALGSDLHWQALELAQRLESPQLAAELLESLASGLGRQVLDNRLGSRIGSELLSTVLGRLVSTGHVQQKSGRLILTSLGQQFWRYFSSHRLEIQLALRKAMARATRRHSLTTGRNPLRGRRQDVQGLAQRRLTSSLEPGEALQEIAWPETIMAAAKGGPAAGPLRIQGADFRVRQRVRRRPVDICLLIDASASMAGERMRAAKALVRHLLLSTRDKVAVVVFQERQVRLTVPFTRNATRVESGLASIRPFGLTPLAAGLDATADYVRQSRPRNPLLMLVTDGIPTVPHQGRNPMEDALQAAAGWRQLRASFTCVGLQPNEGYLSDLVAAADGSLYVVAELEADSLVAIATSERARRAAQASR